MTDFAIQIALLLVGCYLVGTIPFGLLVARTRGIDIRQHGSGNYGATNVSRVLGKKYGALVLVLDVAKGACTSLAGKWFIDRHAGALAGEAADLVWLGTGVMCVLGNTYPFYLGFRGGKGVATALGVILGIYPYLTFAALVALVVWVFAALTWRYVSLASMIAAALLPVFFLAFAYFLEWRVSHHYPLLILTLVMAGIVILRHRANIGRLLTGTESRIGQRGKSASAE
jgi:glycerol-3-phosphate acyltransferase PlsY